MSDDEIPKRFRREAAAIASIKHPGIVDVMDFGELDDGNLYILMEFLKGQNLRERLDSAGTLSMETALTITRQTADALNAAHNCNIVHRDLKPANIFLVPDSLVRGGERVKLLDFGIAKLMDINDGSSLVTKSGVIMGTPIYMSPEQCRGAGDVDHRTDLYALGCILFEMLTGRPPFKNKAAGELIVLHLTQQPPSVRSINSSIPSDVDALIAKLLAKEPQDRPGSARELVAALDEALGQHSSRRYHRSPAPEFAQMAAPYTSAPGHGTLPTGSAVDVEPPSFEAAPLGQPDHTDHTERDVPTVPPTEKIELGLQVRTLPSVKDTRKPGAGHRAGSRAEHRSAPVPLVNMPRNNGGSVDIEPSSPETSRPSVRRPRVRRSPVAPGPAVAKANNRARQRAKRTTGSAPQPAVPASHSIFGTGMLTRAGRSRTTWLLQIGILGGACVGGIVYLIVWMVGSFQATTSDSPGVAIVRESDVDDGIEEQREIEPELVSRATKSRPAMIALGGGTYMMGSPHLQKWRSKDETPRHQVTLSPFQICRTEVTQAQWKAVMASTPSDCTHGCGDSRPVQNVTWYDAVEYFNRLSRSEGLQPCYRIVDQKVTWQRSCTGYRFPTEAEWEYAARAGTQTIYSFGDNPDDLADHAWFRANSDKVKPVATRKPNRWGLHDIHGNVQEWVWDQFERFYPDGPQVDPTGPPPNKAKRVFRGGSFRSGPKDLRSAVRYWNKPVSANWDTGLRCARSQPSRK